MQYAKLLGLVTILIGVFGGGARAHAIALEPNERLITILSTNDIHGGVEATSWRDGKSGETLTAGGMDLWAGVVFAIRKGLERQHGDRAGVALVDAGDQFQGTLISNFDEGRLVYRIFNEIGYDGVVPGNHAYDFGPTGWLDDRVRPGNPDTRKRGALEELVRLKTFPLLSANTFLKRGKGARPEFVEPYVIKNLAGVRVAIVGLDNVATRTMTTAENVSDLEFEDEVSTYVNVRRSLEGKADLFVIVMHQGDAGADKGGSALVREIRKLYGPRAVDAVVAGHTHYRNLESVDGVPLVQSGSGGEAFGRIDLVWNTKTKRLVGGKTRAFAGVRLFTDRCESNIPFCEQAPSIREGTPVLRYEGEIAARDRRVAELMRDAREAVAPMAERKLGVAEAPVQRSRAFESGLADALTDVLREMTGAEIAFLNTGGIRADIDAGEITYEELFRVFPFGNRAVTVAPLSVEVLVELVERSMRTCGGYGALIPSGIRATFAKSCKGNGNVDEQAYLLTIDTLSGEKIYDRAQGGIVARGRTFVVATLDFLADGGSGYTAFRGIPVVRDFGILREAMTEAFLARPAHLSGKRDGRWRDVPRVSESENYRGVFWIGR